MALTGSYLVTTKNLGAFLAAIQAAQAPERFNNKFLNDLDFKSSNDRLFIAVLKGLGFIDESGVPTRRYFAFLDQSESGRVLAEAIRESYEDLFAVNKKANDLSEEEVKNKLKTLTQGKKSDNVVKLMASTFTALCGMADWVAPISMPNLPEPDPTTEKTDPLNKAKSASRTIPTEGYSPLRLHYDIHVHLPESRDPAVFDAIFQAMRTHLGG